MAAGDGTSAAASPVVRPDTLLGLGFVALWGTGFVAAKYGLPWAGPFDFLATRFAIVAVLMLALAALLRVTALIVGTQPVLTAVVVGPLLGERVRLHQWLGFALGFAGLVLVVGERLTLPDGDDLGGLALVVLALFGITAGTLYQKRFCPTLDLRSGTAIQYLAAAAAMIPLALLFDPQPIRWTPQFVLALGWLSLVLSLGAISLLFLLIRRGAASRVASLFFLVPPTAAAYAWLLFGETLGPAALTGMAVITVGVALVNRD